MRPRDLTYRILDVHVAVSCAPSDLRSLIQAHWGCMACDSTRSDLAYAVTRSETSSEIAIVRSGQETKWTADEGEFLFELEADSCFEIQTIRKDLYFVHSAVAEFEGKAYLFVAESGGGKSTTLWGLLHHGWNYLSDELAPVDLSSMRVHAYPRALCLKRQPPPAYPLPDATQETPRTLHVPVSHLPAVSELATCPLAAVYFVKYCPDASEPSVLPISAGEAGARLYANSLNQLAHANAGLEAAARIAKRIPGYALTTADLAATCALLGSHTRQSFSPEIDA